MANVFFFAFLAPPHPTIVEVEAGETLLPSNHEWSTMPIAEELPTASNRDSGVNDKGYFCQ